jgi:hypothetical protein
MTGGLCATIEGFKEILVWDQIGWSQGSERFPEGKRHRRITRDVPELSEETHLGTTLVYSSWLTIFYQDPECLDVDTVKVRIWHFTMDIPAEGFCESHDTPPCPAGTGIIIEILMRFNTTNPPASFAFDQSHGDMRKVLERITLLAPLLTHTPSTGVQHPSPFGEQEVRLISRVARVTSYYHGVCYVSLIRH